MRPEPLPPSPMPARAPAPEELVGLLADEGRRRIVAALEQGPRRLAELAGSTSGSIRQVIEDLSRLTRAGAVVEDAGNYRLVDDIFERSARDAALERIGELNDVDTRLFRRYFYRNRLVGLPAEPWARRTVLDLIVEDFQPDRTYNEREVNTTLYGWYGDWALLRRLLVDHGYLTRSHGEYRRADAGGEALGRQPR